MLFAHPNKPEDEKEKHLQQVWNQVNVKNDSLLCIILELLLSFSPIFLIFNNGLYCQFFANEASWKAMNDKQLANLTDFGKILMEKIIQDVSSKRPWNSNENGKFAT